MGHIILEGKDGQKIYLSKQGARIFPDDTEGAMVNIPLWKVGEKTLSDWTGRAGEAYGVLRPTQYFAEKIPLTKPDPTFGLEMQFSYEGFEQTGARFSFFDDFTTTATATTPRPATGAMPLGYVSVEMFETLPTKGLIRSQAQVARQAYQVPEKIKSGKLDTLHKKLDKLDEKIGQAEMPPTKLIAERKAIQKQI